MIPTAFEYESPTTVEDALRLLAEGGEDVKVLAGGQSLIPVLKLRLAGPELIVDLGRIEGLRGVREDGDALVIGATTPHHEVATSALVREHAALLVEAAGTVADPQVRHRGTFGGALVHADPAGDLPAPALALGASFEIAGPAGVRTVAAEDFFVDLFTTAVGEDEILTAVRVPKRTGWTAAYEKFVRVAQQWSIVAVAATVRVEDGVIADARLGLTNMGSTPIRPAAVEQNLVGLAPVGEAVEGAVADVAAGTTPPDDLNGTADYRRHLARVLARRAVVRAAGA
ncbi:xanthine dehydrogenase family protein subunit M [Mumia sp. zg.B17]|uniref:FAD binding domain-containing protein n=1 Tax=unclassified Mumia TaxID=2621872 RepID=UPI001C6E1348|nr:MULTISPECIES: xanthine dehydrogenase family protein subunit M [unclassified Mumia]MBW9207041.1 xanthine dehydrogenase family protein subunit M [Mumia sp. zg.B17]MBW9210623.1 xanthine dehydrogenase family protein subunit M [Mumia sp. zg.B21]MDD9349098.1 xanthine dehydrogenase family protein subunit M [Mumia sp.]